MRTDVVLTVTGPERIGIVEQVTRLLLDLDGNVEASRMARLGGEFAILMLVSLPSEQLASLDRTAANLIDQGFKVTTTRTDPARAPASASWVPYEIEVQGADHEGIIHGVAQYLSQRGINIESIDTGTARAPISGTPLFTMSALVVVPPDRPGQSWQADLEQVGRNLSVDIRVSPAKKE
ncbi:MAG: transcriptional regulator [Chloroflexi bacterium]|nr:transcriptional regulator [Chloroflexota bacterium]